MIKCLATGFNLSPSLSAVLANLFLVAKTCPRSLLLHCLSTADACYLLLVAAAPSDPSRLQHFHGTWGLAPLPYQWMQNKTEFCFAELRSSPAIFWPDVWVKSESSHVCLSQIQSERLLHWSCPNMSVPKVNEAMWHCLANFSLLCNTYFEP